MELKFQVGHCSQPQTVYNNTKRVISFYLIIVFACNLRHFILHRVILSFQKWKGKRENKVQEKREEKRERERKDRSKGKENEREKTFVSAIEP